MKYKLQDLIDMVMNIVSGFDTCILLVFISIFIAIDRNLDKSEFSEEE
jgi:hypothetical protein